MASASDFLPKCVIVRSRAFSLPEIVLTLGVILVLLALALPPLARVRGRAREVTSLSNVRQLGTLVELYGGDYRDSPPVLFQPIWSNPRARKFQRIVVGGDYTVDGAWFTNGTLFHLAMAPAPGPEVLYDPAGPRNRAIITVGGSVTCLLPDFGLTSTLYATPEYFDRDTQQGPAQWRVQKLQSTTFPARKGMIYQRMVFGPDLPALGVDTALTNRTSAVLWFDGSATQTVQRDLESGVPNGWHHGLEAPVTVLSQGAPIDETLHGVRGFDRR